MTPLEIVFEYIGRDGFPCLPDIVPFRQVSLVIFEGAEPTLDQDVVRPAAFAVHALPDAVLLQEVLVNGTGELASLVGV